MERLRQCLTRLLLLLLLATPLALGDTRASTAPAALPAPTAATTDPRAALSQTPPPLPRSCIVGGTPPDYATPLCCVSGYVYLNGTPVENAGVTLRANGQSITVQTAFYPGSDRPYYTAGLDAAPLNVRPGDAVTVEATAGGQRKSITFTAVEGGLQADVVLPQSVVDAQWARADIPGHRGTRWPTTPRVG